MKPYLLIAGSNYYPEHSTGDWVGCFETEEEAKSKVEEVVFLTEYFTKGKKKGEVKQVHSRFKIKHDKWGNDFDSEWTYDWYDIVDLRKWMEK